MANILGLDVGTNSIGGALISIEQFGEEGKIIWLGSRIIPLDGDSLMKFENGGQAETKAAARRLLRGSRRLKHRYKLRRARLVKVLTTLKWMPDTFPLQFEGRGDGFNINQYLPLSEGTKQAAYEAFGTEKVSEDWLVYFLRKKALTDKITLPELARILYMMNQRRGFKSNRKEVKAIQDEEEKWPRIEKWNEIVNVTAIIELSRERDKTVYRVEAGEYAGEITRKQRPDWLGKQLELEITQKTTKAGEVSFTFRTPDKTDWEKKKEALHKDFYEWRDKGLCSTIGAYFLEHLLADKNYRIRQQVIDRSLYREELEAIWTAQTTFHPELTDKGIMPTLAKLLYDKNADKQRELAANDLFYLLTNDIIYYQRPLKSARHLIDTCRLEPPKSFMRDGIAQSVGIKVAPKSSPEAQEIRVWQDIHNMRIFETNPVIDGRSHPETEVTAIVLNDDAKAKLFKLFDESAEKRSSLSYSTKAPS